MIGIILRFIVLSDVFLFFLKFRNAESENCDSEREALIVKNSRRS